MILDSGILTIYRTIDTAEPGGMPRQTLQALYRGWYGLRAWGSRRRDPTGARPDRQIDCRVRILRLNDLREGDLVILSDVAATGVLTPAYRVEEFYQAADEESGELISDLYLQRYEKAVIL